MGLSWAATNAAYYSYTSPEPDLLSKQALPIGEWSPSGAGSLVLLPYEEVPKARDPRNTLLAFLQGANEAGARTAGWDTSDFAWLRSPSPVQLPDLQVSASANFGRSQN